MVRRFLIKVLVSSAAIWVADILLSDFAVVGGLAAYLWAGLLLGAINTFIRPLVKLITFPLILLTLGTFTVVINAAILWFVARVLGPTLLFENVWALVWATFIISIVQTFLDPITKKHD